MFVVERFGIEPIFLYKNSAGSNEGCSSKTISYAVGNRIFSATVGSLFISPSVKVTVSCWPSNHSVLPTSCISNVANSSPRSVVAPKTSPNTKPLDSTKRSNGKMKFIR